MNQEVESVIKQMYLAGLTPKQVAMQLGVRTQVIEEIIDRMLQQSFIPS